MASRPGSRMVVGSSSLRRVVGSRSLRRVVGSRRVASRALTEPSETGGNLHSFITSTGFL